MEKYIGLDLGTTTLGVVYSDSLGIIHNYENFNFERGNFKKAREHVIEVSNKLEIKNIVIGLPLQVDRNEGKRCESTRRFVNDILKLDDSLNFIYFDESYTTFEAKERLENMGLTKEKVKENIDMMSAYIILEDYMRNMKNGK